MFVRHEIYQTPFPSSPTHLGAYSNALLVSRLVRFTVRWVTWKKYICVFQGKNLNFIFGFSTSVICLYTPSYIRMNTSGHICAHVYMHALFSFPPFSLRSIPLSPCAGAYLYFYASIWFFSGARTLFICMRNSFFFYLVFVILRNKGFLIHICICIRVSIYPRAIFSPSTLPRLLFSFSVFLHLNDKVFLFLFLCSFFRRWKFVRECFAYVWQDENGKDEMAK